MLTLKYITENTDEVIARLKKKNFDGSEIINNIAELDAVSYYTSPSPRDS